MDCKKLLLVILILPTFLFFIIFLTVFYLAAPHIIPVILQNTIFILLGIVISVGISYIVASKLFERLERCKNLLQNILLILEMDPSVIDDPNVFETVTQEIEKLKRTYEKFKNYRKEIKRTIDEIIDVVFKLEQGDLTVRMDENRKYNKLQKSFNRAMSNISQLIKDLRDHIDRLNAEVNKLREEIEKTKEISDQVT
ncbi:MAG TPA: methyl-accepting chemotaxis protein, partial [Methanothermococcus okinawensis]|nr:methyl-accepting chemotaxis protein [Methanothermococcus okinawensis]